MSADTLCYFGALEAAIAGAANALRPGGRIVFTVERAADEVRDYHLDPTGRFSHAERYVQDTLGASGFDSISIEHVVLRSERGKEVHGLLASATRTS